MLYKYKYNEDHLRYMKEQIWEAKEDIEIYSKLSEFEYEQTKDYMRSVMRIPKYTIMDLGCGLGRFAIYLNQIWGDHEIHYTLADTTGDTTNTGGWNLDEYYNNLDLTNSFCKLNGLKNFEVFDTKKHDWDGLPGYDLIISHCAFGMHFPIEDIMPKLLQVANLNITMIFGTRNRGMYSEKSFNDLFEDVKFIKQEQVLPFPQQDWLILRGKK